MTRYTSLGRKRTYFQAGFDNETKDGQSQVSNTVAQEAVRATTELGRDVPSKKVKVHSSGDGGDDTADLSSQKNSETLPEQKESDAHGPRNGWNIDRSKLRRAALASESRRLKRIQIKQSDTTCFACREKGHAAKDCPKTASVGDRLVDNPDSALEEDRDTEGRSGKKEKRLKNTVGMCYRCGSRKHTLSRCPKSARRPPNGDGESYNPLPFASCFVCLQQGHLASTCPQNKHKGVYPHGGACKLCGEKTHLAKDCELDRKKYDAAQDREYRKTDAAGADEDDFHVIQREKIHTGPKHGPTDQSTKFKNKNTRTVNAPTIPPSSNDQAVQGSTVRAKATKLSIPQKKSKVINF